MASGMKTLSNLIYGLEDALSFMRTFDEYAEESFGCICDVKEGEKCQCVTEDGHLRVISKEKILEDARSLLTGLKEEEENKFYKRYDLQDESDYSIETLEEMRIWLADFWGENPDEDMDDEEHDEWIEEILQADAEELFDMLAGVDYSYYELDENEEVIPKEEMKRGVSFSNNRSVIAEKRRVVEITVTDGEDKKTITTTPDKWEEVFYEQVGIFTNQYLKENSL